GNYCVVFAHMTRSTIRVTGYDVTPNNRIYVHNRTEHCLNQLLMVNTTSESKALPPGYVLICGDRAWQGIPAQLLGGPCYVGKLTLFAPSITQVLSSSHRSKRRRHSISQMGPDCKDEVELWDRPEVIVASIFSPGVASAQALTQLHRLACWTAKQINITSNILSTLTADLDSVRHAVLQNQAAIDFLLLAQGHGCEEFEGMCCMNLSDHSNSIHCQLSLLRENMNKLQVTSDPFTTWLTSLGFGSWFAPILKMVLMVVVALICFMLLMPCLLQCMQA
ncbi:SYNA protein, partial [Chloropsis hardwickii]|nr:SYNA protein [Chloropsis hardwickii]